MNFNKNRMVAAMAVVFLVPTTSFATNGYFSHGYGVKSSSMGGAGVAHPQDSMAAATNPAGMVYVGNRVDLGAQLFNPNRENSHTGGANTGTTESKNNLFLIPHVGYNTMLDSNTSFGVAVFGNGGMNTSYRRNNDTFGPANSKLGV
ncbi:MAG: outer membrane protein transport protein, partial [Gammaproteobacteria bacterium]|nr:outer membrane protein transport protein [Gammaproteobacteria bacterium]